MYFAIVVASILASTTAVPVHMPALPVIDGSTDAVLQPSTLARMKERVFGVDRGAGLAETQSRDERSSGASGSGQQREQLEPNHTMNDVIANIAGLPPRESSPKEGRLLETPVKQRHSKTNISAKLGLLHPIESS